MKIIFFDIDYNQIMTVTSNNSIIPQLNTYVVIKKLSYVVKEIETNYDTGIISIQLN